MESRLKHDIIINRPEEYPSGRRGRFRKPIEDASLARVQIPFPPPVEKKYGLGRFFL